MEPLAAQIQEHFRKAIEGSEMLTVPFPHLAVDRVLPDAIFERLVNDLPGFQHLVPMSKTGWSSVTRYERRGTLPVSDLTAVSDFQVWDAVRSALDSPQAEQALKRKFSTWFGDEIDEYLRCDLRREVRAHCDLGGSHMAPHTDAPSMFITSFIYMKSGREDDSLDTLLYAPLDPERRLVELKGKQYGHEDPDWHSETSRVRFRPNRMFSFLRTMNSVHGFGPVSASAAPRYLISLHLKYASEIGL